MGNCKYGRIGVCEKLFRPSCPDDESCYEYELMTNADRIRAMSDVELADSRVGEIIGIAPCSLWVAIDVPDKQYLSKKRAVAVEHAWLQQPAEEK